MEVVYLGLLEKVFNWVFDAILSPVFKFISDILEKALTWLFNEVLAPLIDAVFRPLLISVVKLVYDILAGVLYSIFASFLKLIDAMQTAFEIFAGLKEVTFKGEDYTLLQLLFTHPTVQKAILVVTAVAFALMMMFAVFGTLKSMMDLDGEVNRPVSKVLSSTLKAFLKMLLVPSAALFAILMSCSILVGMKNALNSDNATLSGMVFVVSSLDAAKDARYNVSGKATDDEEEKKIPDSQLVKDIGINDPLRHPYYIGDKNHQYDDKEQVAKDFTYSRFDYLIGYGGCIFLVITLAICLMHFITRIFEVILLVLVAPFFAAVMPLDDGEKFNSWQEMFIAKIFTGYGTVVAMQIYMILCPAIMSGTISFGDASPAANYLIRFIFLLGGAWATVKAGPTITTLLNFHAGAAEQDTTRMVTAGAMSAAHMAKGLALGAAGMAYRGAKSMYHRRDNALNKADAKYNKSKMKGDKSGLGKDGPGKEGGDKEGGKAEALAKAAKIGGQAAKKAGGVAGKSVKKAGEAAGSGVKKAGSAAVEGSNKTSVNANIVPGGGSKPTSQAGRVSSFLGGHITWNKSENGHHYVGVDFGSFAKFGRDENGNYHAKMLGIGYTESADGSNRKIEATPMLKFKNGEDGKMHLSAVKTGICNVKRAYTEGTDADGNKTRKYGSMYCSSFAPLGISRRCDKSEGTTHLSSVMGVHFAQDNPGEDTHLSQINILGTRLNYEKGSDNQTHYAGHVGWITQSERTEGADGKRHTTSVRSAGAEEGKGYWYNNENKSGGQNNDQNK